MMSLDRWSDDRLDDVANELRALRNLPAQAAEHGVRLESMQRTLQRHEGLIASQDERADKLAESLRWTPALKAGIIVPTLASLIAAAAMVLTRGAG